MLKTFARNNLSGSSNLFKECLKLKLEYKKGFSVQCSSRLATVVQSKQEGLVKHRHVFCSQRSDDRGYCSKTSNSYSSNKSVRFKSDGRDTNRDETTVSSNDLKPISIPKDDILKILNKFYVRPHMKDLADRFGLKGNFFHKAFIAFRKHCVEQKDQPAALVDALKEAKDNHDKLDSLFSHFLTFSKTQFPHLNFIEELKEFSDLSDPPEWYPEARSKQRKVIYHAGPTNSGKTYHALQRFLGAKSGIYCGPLRLLAVENFKKSNEKGTPCDLITGEERKYVNESGEPATHQACTVEMTNLSEPYEVAVIDEIQMIRDSNRGWAWTRAFLGVCADEIHVCGEESGIELIRELCSSTGDEFQVQKYQRLTPLTVLDKALEDFDNVRPGDCIVCFNKNDIFNVCKELEKKNVEVAVIYGTLPPATKLAHAEKFNDPSHPCKVMVATDAVGMGLNLSIKRVIFYSLTKPSSKKNSKEKFELIRPSAALQIAGRAGRFNTQFEGGEVTTFRVEDLPVLNELLDTPVERIEKAGLAPTLEQIELCNLCMPEVTLAETMDIFSKLCTMDNSRYFMTDLENFKFLAALLEGMPLRLRHMYTFCCAPISDRQGATCSMFVKFARQFSKGIPMTLDWVCNNVGWPLRAPATTKDLMHLEEVHDIFDLYHWLSYRYPDMFPHTDPLSKIQDKLDVLIREGIHDIVKRLDEPALPVPDRMQFPLKETSDGEVPDDRSSHDPAEDASPDSPDRPNVGRAGIRGKSRLTLNFLAAQNELAQQGKKRSEELEKLDLESKNLSLKLVSLGVLTPRILKMLEQEFLGDLNSEGRTSRTAQRFQSPQLLERWKRTSSGSKDGKLRKPKK